MTAKASRLRVVQASRSGPSRFTVATQVIVSGAQETAVRILTPISGSPEPQIAVRVGRLMVLVGDRKSLVAFVDAWAQAETLADQAFGPELPPPQIGEGHAASR